MTMPNEIRLALSLAPVTVSTKISVQGNVFKPSITLPLMPPPTALCPGERRSSDGGVEPAPRATAS